MRRCNVQPVDGKPKQFESAHLPSPPSSCARAGAGRRSDAESQQKRDHQTLGDGICTKAKDVNGLDSWHPSVAVDEPGIGFLQ
jgi:hypothetical protein